MRKRAIISQAETRSDDQSTLPFSIETRKPALECKRTRIQRTKPEEEPIIHTAAVIFGGVQANEMQRSWKQEESKAS